jgi:squalene-associated FAD-dependent desaturase
MRVGIVGAGWAGCAAAVQAMRQGHEVQLIEAARQAGGRARRLGIEHRGQTWPVDNGQHILIGAYTQTQQLMRELGLQPEQHLQRLPLSLTFADGRGLQLPRWPRWAPPTGAVALGVLGARGWRWPDKLALLHSAWRWQRAGFVCDAHTTVAQLCKGLTPLVIRELIEPLCVAALNTPAQRASGQVFLRVLRDALFDSPGGSDLLLPTTDLSQLLPDAALRALQLGGQTVRLGARVLGLYAAGRQWALQIQQDGATNEERFDALVLACPANEAARLVQALPSAASWAEQANTLAHEAIATVYAWAPGARLKQPMVALREGEQAPAQFVFDRGLLGGPSGLLAFVVSASPDDRQVVQAGVLTQAAQQLGLHGLKVVQTVMERRATFACTPALLRPPMQVLADDARLLACGDYVQGPYPATLEGAVRSGLAAGQALRR